MASASQSNGRKNIVIIINQLISKKKKIKCFMWIGFFFGNKSIENLMLLNKFKNKKKKSEWKIAVMTICKSSATKWKHKKFCVIKKITNSKMKKKKNCTNPIFKIWVSIVISSYSCDGSWLSGSIESTAFHFHRFSQILFFFFYLSTELWSFLFLSLYNFFPTNLHY